MSSLDPIIRDVRQSKIQYFKDQFSSDFDEPASRFVAEMIWGIIFAGSIRLSKIARALEESIPERATIKRLSRNLSKKGLGSTVGKKILELGSERIKRDTFLIVHRYSLLKKYAKSMEFLDVTYDETGRVASKGYELCDVIGWNPELKEITSLAQSLWSKNAPDYAGESELSLFKQVMSVLDGRGIFVHMPFGDRELLIQLTKEDACRYMFPLLPDDHLLYNRKNTSILELIDRCKTPYGDTVFIDHENREMDIFVHYGFLPVRLPEFPDRPLWLVAIKGFDEKFAEKQLIMILTTEPMRQNRKILWRIVEAYFSALWIQMTNQLIKQRCDFEDVRVLTYARLKNISALVLAGSYFSTVFQDFPLSNSPVRFRRQNRRSALNKFSPG